MTIERIAPGLFVFIWSTGFIVAKLVAPYAEPLTFLCLRYAGTIVVLSLLAFASGARWPSGMREWRNAAIAGVLLQGLYLGGVFWAVRHGLSAGMAALITGLQPLLTGLLAGPLLGEEVTLKRWIGLVAGLCGAALVVAPALRGVDALPIPAVAVCFVAMISVTSGTLWQKRFGGGPDLRTSAAVQFMAALFVTLPVAFAIENFEVSPAPPFWIGLLWAIGGLSTGGILLLLGLIARGAVAGVAALFYLVPPVSALMAFALFGETLTAIQMAGMALAAAGVAIAARG